MSNKRTGWEICQEIINAQDLINAQAINKTNMTYKVKKRTGWEIFLKLINAQCLISSHRTDFFLKKNKRTCATIRQVRVPCFLVSRCNFWYFGAPSDKTKHDRRVLTGFGDRE